ncbi:ABC transporter permease [Nocardioides stalactiti]|uniref:ABC transporter permease n=1 Tax=Nocardioides stalactiti TaxID=2755356 RepID=UPI00160038C6|nr:ABC transporter permease [Nocardioides stalactiti]
MKLFELTWQYLTTAASWTGEGGLLDRMGEQLLLTVTALLVGMLVGLPLALWLGHLGRGGFLAINISNIGRAIPTFALLAVLVTADWPGPAYFGPYGRAGLATLIALALFALPPLVTNAYTAVREVSADVLEAADGMGMSGLQRFWRVELPLALPLVMSGVRLALVQVWATATIAALVAGPGIGAIIVSGFARNRYSEGIGAALVVAVVALVLEVLAALVQRAVTPGRAAAPRRKTRQPVGAGV